jgi:hypothetical protein
MVNKKFFKITRTLLSVLVMCGVESNAGTKISHKSLGRKLLQFHIVTRVYRPHFESKLN